MPLGLWFSLEPVTKDCLVGRNKPRPLPPSPFPLELSPDVMRSMLQHATERIIEHIGSLPQQPMHATKGGRKLARRLAGPMPESGEPFEKLFRTLFGEIIPASLNTASPGYLAYIPGGGIFHSAVADLIADATNRYVGVWIAAPGLAQIEENVIQWFATMLGMPPSAGGPFLTGGSLANPLAEVSARREKLPPNFLQGTLYTSEEAHHSVLKAALLAGILPEHVRSIPSDDHFRMQSEALGQAIRDDRAAGRTPFLIVASAGTTNTGAVDDLERIADIATAEGCWLHVDAAYGGFFALTERGRKALAGIERADSVTLDPHKGLFLPDCPGWLVFRGRGSFRRAHAVPAAYLPPMQHEEGLVDFCELGPELSRDARGLRVWLPIAMHGASVFRAALDEKLDLARHAANELRKIPGVEIIAEPMLSLLAFRMRFPQLTSAEEDARNRQWMSLVNQKQRVLLTGTTTKGRFLIRICILSFRTHVDRIEMALEDLRTSLTELPA